MVRIRLPPAGSRCKPGFFSMRPRTKAGVYVPVKAPADLSSKFLSLGGDRLAGEDGFELGHACCAPRSRPGKAFQPDPP